MPSVRTDHYDSNGSLDAHVRLIRQCVLKSLAEGETVQLATRIVSGAYDLVEDPLTGQSVPAIEAWGSYYRAPDPGVTCRMRDDYCEITKIWNFVVLNIRYTLDPSEVDTFRTLRRSLEAGSVDCDDFTIIFAALLKAVGFKVRARVCSVKGQKSWAHIYPMVEVPKESTPGVESRWVPLDVTVEGVGPDWEYPYINKYRDFEL